MAEANQLVSFQDLQDLIDNEGFVQNNPFTPSDKLADRVEVENAIIVESLASIPANQLIMRSLIIGGDEPGLTQFILDGQGYTSSTISCATDSYNPVSRQHNGVGSLPDVGDIIYTIDGYVFGGANFYWLHDSGVSYKIDNSGVVVSIEDCGPIETFEMGSVNFNSHSDACSSTSTTVSQFTHNGVHNLPAYGDTVYYQGSPVAAGFRKSDNSSSYRFIRQFNSSGVYILGKYC